MSSPESAQPSESSGEFSFDLKEVYEPIDLIALKAQADRTCQALMVEHIEGTMTVEKNMQYTEDFWANFGIDQGTVLNVTVSTDFIRQVDPPIIEDLSTTMTLMGNEVGFIVLSNDALDDPEPTASGLTAILPFKGMIDKGGRAQLSTMNVPIYSIKRLEMSSIVDSTPEQVEGE